MYLVRISLTGEVTAVTIPTNCTRQGNFLVKHFPGIRNLRAHRVAIHRSLIAEDGTIGTKVNLVAGRKRNSIFPAHPDMEHDQMLVVVHEPQGVEVTRGICSQFLEAKYPHNSGDVVIHAVVRLGPDTKVTIQDPETGRGWIFLWPGDGTIKRQTIGSQQWTTVVIDPEHEISGPFYPKSHDVLAKGRPRSYLSALVEEERFPEDGNGDFDEIGGDDRGIVRVLTLDRTGSHRLGGLVIQGPEA